MIKRYDNLNENIQIFRKIKFNILNEDQEIKIGISFFDPEKIKVIKDEINKLIDKRVYERSRTRSTFGTRIEYAHCDGSYQIEKWNYNKMENKDELEELELYDSNNVKIILPLKDSNFSMSLLNLLGISLEKIAEYLRPYKCTIIGDIAALYRGGFSELRYKKRKDTSRENIKGGLMRTGLYTVGGTLAGSLLGNPGIGAATGGLVGAGQSIYNYFGNKDTLKFSDYQNMKGGN